MSRVIALRQGGGENWRMPRTRLNPYDEFPYESLSFAATHPEVLAVTSILRGVEPRDVETCRVLELGCALGGNLIPMAFSLPRATFLGVDLSERQISVGNSRIEELGLKNIKLEQKNILDIGPELGEFDFILCHGVFSWVPPVVQQGILRVISQNLAPHGIAYVSYNVFPGWLYKSLIREMMFFHLEGVEGAVEKAKKTRELLDALSKAMENGQTLYSSMIRLIVESIKPYPDFYLLHEYLEEENRPLYFHHFAKMAASHRLQYVGEERDLTFEGLISDEAWKKIDEFARDRVRREQYVDFFLNGTFRRSLLCREGVELHRSPENETLKRFLFSTKAKPKDEVPDFSDGHVAKFFLKSGQVVTTNDPGVKAVITELFRVWPKTLSFSDLLREVSSRYPEMASRESLSELLLDALRRCQGARMVHLHLREPGYVPSVSQRPVGSPVARFQANFNDTVTNLLHEAVSLNAFDREILKVLDGAHDQESIVDILVEDMKTGAVEVEEWPADKTSPEDVRQEMTVALTSSLRRLASLALLVG